MDINVNINRGCVAWELYENDLPLRGNEIEDIDIVPVKHIPASENIPVEDEEEKKLRIMYDILTLKETDQDTTEEVVEELINKSVEELLTIYEELKESKTKSLK